MPKFRINPPEVSLQVQLNLRNPYLAAIEVRANEDHAWVEILCINSDGIQRRKGVPDKFELPTDSDGRVKLGRFDPLAPAKGE